MKQTQIPDLLSSQRRLPAIAIQLSLVGLLSACGNGSSGTQTEPTVGEANSESNSEAMGQELIAGPSISAAQLSNDGNYSVGFAQAVAAGIQPAPIQVASVPTNVSSEESATTETDSTDSTSSTNPSTDSESIEPVAIEAPVVVVPENSEPSPITTEPTVLPVIPDTDSETPDAVTATQDIAPEAQIVVSEVTTTESEAVESETPTTNTDSQIAEPEIAPASPTVEPEPQPEEAEESIIEAQPTESEEDATDPEPEPAESITDPQPEPAETEESITEPEPAPADTEENVIDPEPEPAETEESITDPAPEPAETEDNITDPAPAPTETEESITDAEPAPADTEESITNPEPAETEENVTEPEPEPEATETEESVTEPEPVETEESVTEAEPEPEPEPEEPTNATETEAPVAEEPTSPPQTESEPEAAAPATMFYSTTTEGFNGEVLSDSVRITWPVDSAARGYNVYRQAEYITSVFTEEYIDLDVHDNNYYYEIQAFDYADNLYYVATGLTVKPRSFGTTDPDAGVPNEQLLDGYNLVFSDEFNDYSLDTTKWNTSYLWGTDLIINSEEQYYVDIKNEPDFGYNPFTFDGNNLTINSIKTPGELAGKALNQPYLSGVITSYDAFKFTYGYIEARAKVTFGRGYWPAFWLLNAYYVDDKPEIDIMEFIGHNQDVVYHTYHYYDSDGVLRSTKSEPTPGVDYTEDFYTYGVEWKPSTLIFYINDVEVHRIVDSKVSQQEMYVIANTALGGWWAGSPDNTTPFPGKFEIDYIRVYQKSQPYDDTLFNDGISQVPYADAIFGTSSPSHRPSKEDWPEGYPDGL